MQDNTQEGIGDTSRHVATSPDLSRHDATGDDILTVDEMMALFQDHGRIVGKRTMQRYCEKDHIKHAIKQITAEGELWLAPRSSVLNRLKELDDFDKLRKITGTTNRGKPRHVVNVNENLLDRDNLRQATTENLTPPVASAQNEETTPIDMSRQAATGHDRSAELTRIEVLYKKIIELKDEQVGDLRKDKDRLQTDKEVLIDQLKEERKLHHQQIEHLLSSDRDSKSLAKTVTNFVHSIWPGTKGATGGELPEAYGRIVSEVPNTLPDDEPGQHP